MATTCSFGQIKDLDLTSLCIKGSEVIEDGIFKNVKNTSGQKFELDVISSNKDDKIVFNDIVLDTTLIIEGDYCTSNLYVVSIENTVGNTLVLCDPILTKLPLFTHDDGTCNTLYNQTNGEYLGENSMNLTAFGKNALQNIGPNSSDIIAIGQDALKNISKRTFEDIIALGKGSALNLQSGSRNSIVIGSHEALKNGDVRDSIVVKTENRFSGINDDKDLVIRNSISMGFTNANMYDTIVMNGSGSSGILSDPNSIARDTIAFGIWALEDTLNANHTIAFGNFALPSCVNSSYNLIIGQETLGGTNHGNNNVCIGHAIHDLSNFASFPGINNTVAIGASASVKNTGTDPFPDYTVTIGYEAYAGSKTVSIGAQCKNRGAPKSVCVGYAVRNYEFGSSNDPIVCIGGRSNFANTTMNPGLNSEKVIIGHNNVLEPNSGGSDNVLVVGCNNNTSNSNNPIALGHNNDFGGYDTCIGLGNELTFRNNNEFRLGFPFKTSTTAGNVENYLCIYINDEPYKIDLHNLA